MGCSSSKRVPKAPQAPTKREEEQLAEAGESVKALPERVEMVAEIDGEEEPVELIAGEYQRNRVVSYDKDPLVVPATQQGVGSWGTSDRFASADNGVPGHEYILPEVTGTDPCGAVFGAMTSERFPDPDNGVPGAKYDIPEERDACNAVFGNMTGERFPSAANGVPGVGTYDVTIKSPNASSAWGAMTSGRFPSADNGVPGPKYDVLRFPGNGEPCFALFGEDKDMRMTMPADFTKDSAFKYDAAKSFDMATRGGRRATTGICGFGKTSGSRFAKTRRASGRMYDTRPTWHSAGGSTFGQRTASRFAPTRPL